MISSIPGHEMAREARPVERYSSSWNMDYMSSEVHLVCTCGHDVRLTSILGSQSEEERLERIEHAVNVLAGNVPAAHSDS